MCYNSELYSGRIDCIQQGEAIELNGVSHSLTRRKTLRKTGEYLLLYTVQYNTIHYCKLRLRDLTWSRFLVMSSVLWFVTLLNSPLSLIQGGWA